MKTFADRIIQPLLSEKTTQQSEALNEYALLVDLKMTKVEIKKAVEEIFGVKPLSVRTVVFRKKVRRSKQGEIPTKAYKKALDRLAEGQRIEIK
jgi:large subunit ribosomal protein L23